MSGPVKLVSERLADALKNGGSNLKGVGSTLEGIDLNQFMYEFVLDKAWNSGQTDKEWFLKLADRRTGKVSPEARKAWGNTGRQSVYPAGTSRARHTYQCTSLFKGKWTLDYQADNRISTQRFS